MKIQVLTLATLSYTAIVMIHGKLNKGDTYESENERRKYEDLK